MHVQDDLRRVAQEDLFCEHSLNVGPELAEVEGRWVFLWQAYVCKR